MQKCSFCTEKASVMCTCSKKCCNTHMVAHIQEKGKHLISPISCCSYFQEREELNAEIFKRLKLIIDCKSEIMLKAEGFIKEIKELAESALRKLDEMHSFYCNLVNHIDYTSEALEIVKNVLKTELIKVDNENKNPFEYFNQQFLHEIAQKQLKKEDWIKFHQEHINKIYCAVVIRDEKTVIFAGGDRRIKIFNLNTRKIENVLEGHKASVNSLALTKDENFLVSGSYDTTVRVWTLSEMKQAAVLKGHSKEVLCMSVSLDDKFIASGSCDHTICIWSISDKNLVIKLEEHAKEVNALSFTRYILISGSKDKTIIYWDLNTWTKTGIFKCYKEIKCLSVSSEENHLALGVWKKVQV